MVDLRSLPIVKAIQQQAADSLPLQKALVAGVAMEHGLEGPPWKAGDNGCARGPYQIRYLNNPCDVGNRWKGHNVTAEEAENVTLATAYAISPKGLNYRGNSQKYSSPIDVAFNSERPSKYYSAEQQANAWKAINEIFGSNNGNENGMSVPMPNFQRYPVHSANYDVGRAGVSAEAVAWHIAEGPITAMRGWFNNPAARASANFGIPMVEGPIDLYVDLTNTPYAHGIVEVDYNLARQIIQDNWGINPNLWMYAIEFEGTADQVARGIVPTAFQKQAGAHVTAWLFDTSLYDPAAGAAPKPSRERILMHRDVSPRSRTCPVWNESTQLEMIERVQAWFKQSPPIPPDPPKPPIINPYEKLVREYADAMTLQAQANKNLAGSLRNNAAGLDMQAGKLEELVNKARF